jgi:hypothetical protein
VTEDPKEELARKRAEMKSTVTATQVEITAAFTEWDRRWREDPESFLSEAEALTQDPEDYGSAATPYFLSILKEIQS